MNAVAAVQLLMSRFANDRIQMDGINSAHVIMLFNNPANSPEHVVHGVRRDLSRP